MKATDVGFTVQISTLSVKSSTAPEFVDITNLVKDVIRNSRVRNGIVVVYSKHTTAAIKIQENEPLLLEDMTNLLERLAPMDEVYGHNDFNVRTVHMNEDECPNGHSHCQHLMLSSSESIPLVDGYLALGQYQAIFMVELDRDKSEREILVQVMGV
mgnify:CR=1 FL=1